MSDWIETQRRLAALEAKALTLDDLPLAALKRHMESNWQPDGTTALLPGSIGPSVLANIPAVRAETTGDVTGGSYLISWVSTDYNTGSCWNAVNPTRLTAPISGIYLVTASTIGVVGAAGQWAGHSITANPGVALVAVNATIADAGANIWLATAGAQYLNAGEYFTVRMEDPGGAAGLTHIGTMTWIGANR